MLHVRAWLVPPEQLPGSSLVMAQLFPCCGTIHARLSNRHCDPELVKQLAYLGEEVGRNFHALERPGSSPAVTMRYHLVRHLCGDRLVSMELDRGVCHVELAADLITPELVAALDAHATRLCYQLAALS